jgi:hypothetical protein
LVNYNTNSLLVNYTTRFDSDKLELYSTLLSTILSYSCLSVVRYSLVLVLCKPGCVLYDPANRCRSPKWAVRNCHGQCGLEA